MRREKNADELAFPDFEKRILNSDVPELTSQRVSIRTFAPSSLPARMAGLKMPLRGARHYKERQQWAVPEDGPNC